MFSFQRLSGSDPHVGVEMQSTGEAWPTGFHGMVSHRLWPSFRRSHWNSGGMACFCRWHVSGKMPTRRGRSLATFRGNHHGNPWSSDCLKLLHCQAFLKALIASGVKVTFEPCGP